MPCCAGWRAFRWCWDAIVAETIRALTLASADGIGAATLAVHPLEAPAAGEARVAIRAAALNHRELWIARGLYPGMKLPATLGADGAGVVEAVGPGVDPHWLGKEVVLYPGLGWGDDPRYPAAGFGLLGMPGPGTIAESIIVPVSNLVAKPGWMSFAQAAAVPLGGLTAWRGLMTKAGLQPGERLLVTGAGGGVATFAAAIGKALGSAVWITSGSDETIARAMAAGAVGGVNYRSDQWGKALAKGSGGIDVVFDGAPAAGFGGYARALTMGARVVIYGSTGGPAFTVNAPDLFLKNLRMLGTNVGNPDEFAALIRFVDEHRIEPAIDRVFPLEQAAEALAYLDAGHHFGKVIVEIG